MTTAVLNTIISENENKIPNTSSLVNTNILNTKISEFQNRITDYSKYITTQDFNKLTAENFEARLEQANLVSKTYFDNKLRNFINELPQILKLPQIRITSNYLLGKLFFTCKDGSQNTFFY